MQIENTDFIYLIVAVIVWFLGYFHTGKYVKPKWKIPGKFLFYTSVSFLLSVWIGHFALLFLIGHPLLGLLFHIKVCKANNINWKTCQPKEKYIALQEKWARGDFK